MEKKNAVRHVNTFVYYFTQYYMRMLLLYYIGTYIIIYSGPFDGAARKQTYYRYVSYMYLYTQYVMLSRVYYQYIIYIIKVRQKRQ